MENNISNPEISYLMPHHNQSPSNIRSFQDIPQYYRHIRKEIVSVVPMDAIKILDVGCGAGVLGKALKEQNPKRRVVGIELNDEAYYYAKINIDEVYQAELESFDPLFSPGEFDCIIFADILEHLKDPWSIAGRYASFLKPDGVMIVSIPNIRHLPLLRQVAELGYWRYEDEGILDRTHLRFFTKKDFIELLSQANIVCDSIFYMGGRELYSLRPQDPERTVQLGNFSLSNISDEEFLELCAYQLIFVGIHRPPKNPESTLNNAYIKLSNENIKATVNSLSLVVPWWDHSELLELWEGNLEHLKNVEIIFIDNGSQPAAKDQLKEFCERHKIQLIRNEINRGFSAANNQGVEVATGEYILHLNNDVEILDFSVEFLCTLTGNAVSGPGLIENEIGEIYVEGWALCIKRSLLQALGGWCEDYGPGYWDDVDLCHRIKLAGYPITPIPDIDRWMRHKTNTTGRDGRIDQLALHLRNREIFIKKYYSRQPKILVDGVFFQLYQTGIARVWQSLLEEWTISGFAQHIVVLDRAKTAPKITGIRYRLASAYDYKDTDADREMLQHICDEEGADIFISSYYTTPLSTPSVFMAHDMIPEHIGWDLNHPMWVEKHYGIRHAYAYIAVSENTARDLVKFFPDIPLSSITIAHNGVKANFSPANFDEIHQFKIKYGLSKPYFMLVGAGSGYKNSILFFNAFAQLFSKQGFDILCTGSGGLLEPEFRAYTSGSVIHMLQLSDEELKVAYSGAVALVYPSKYEGFGLPVLEAMACGCPVITCPNGPIPEVAGEAAIYVNDEDVNGLVNALCEVQKPDIRKFLREAGIKQAQQFSWTKMAKIVSSALLDATLLPLRLNQMNLIIFPDWSQPEESLAIDLKQVVSALTSHPDKSKMTLLIDTSGISEEDANLVLSGVAMNLLIQEDVDVTEELEISLVGTLGEIQWDVLLPRLKARIVLDNENQQAISRVKISSVPCFELDSLLEMRSLA